MSLFTGAQRQRATALYRNLLRTTRDLFRDDERALVAAYNETRSRFVAAKNETDPAKIDEGLEMGEQVNYLLKHNVVQGVSKDSTNPSFHLRFTEHTELGSNDTIKSSRPAPSLEDIKRMKGKSASTASTSRAFSTCRQVFASSSSSGGNDDLSESMRPFAVPRPVPRFPGVVILSDGSSVRMTTTSPRHITRTTRDFTNHPLWNPMSSGRSESDADDDMGRLGRFRRRFAGAEAAGAATESQQPAAVSFDESDLSWMSGGREAKPGAAMQTKKGKGKGKK